MRPEEEAPEQPGRDEFHEAWSHLRESITEFKEAVGADSNLSREASAKLESLATELDHDPIHLRQFRTAYLPVFSYLLHRVTAGTAVVASVAGVVAGLCMGSVVGRLGVRGAITYGIATSAFLTITDRARKRGLTGRPLGPIMGGCIGLLVGVAVGGTVLWACQKLPHEYNSFAMIDIPLIGFLLSLPSFLFVGFVLSITVAERSAEGAAFGAIYGALVALIAGGGTQSFFPCWVELAVGSATYAIAGGFMFSGGEGIWVDLRLGAKMSFVYFGVLVPVLFWVVSHWRASPADINEPLSNAWWPALGAGLGVILGAIGQLRTSAIGERE